MPMCPGTFRQVSISKRLVSQSYLYHDHFSQAVPRWWGGGGTRAYITARPLQETKPQFLPLIFRTQWAVLFQFLKLCKYLVQRGIMKCTFSWTWWRWDKHTVCLRRAVIGEQHARLNLNSLRQPWLFWLSQSLMFDTGRLHMWLLYCSMNLSRCRWQVHIKRNVIQSAVGGRQFTDLHNKGA